MVHIILPVVCWSRVHLGEPRDKYPSRTGSECRVGRFLSFPRLPSCESHENCLKAYVLRGRQMLIRCPHCKIKNRIPEDRLDEALQCGRCHQTIFEGAVVDLSESEWADIANHSNRLMVIDFWAEWCGPCKTMAPQFEIVASQLPAIRFAKINTDLAPNLSSTLAIRSIPTLLLWKNGRELDRRAGAMPASALRAWLERHGSDRS